MAYATKDDVALYTGRDPSDLPTDIDRMLERASELIDFVTLGRLVDNADTEALEAARKAVCAQVEYWLAAGEEQDITGPVQGVSLGSLRVDYGPMSAKDLAPRAKRHLWLAGLLYRGVC